MSQLLQVFQMQMLPPSGTSVPSGSSGRITQDIRISNLDKVGLSMSVCVRVLCVSEWLLVCCHSNP